MTECPHCGDEFFVEVLEWYPDERSFTISTCCEVSEQEQLGDIEWASEHEPRELGKWLASQIDAQVRGVLLDLGSDDSRFFGRTVIDHGLRLEPLDYASAASWVLSHHRHNEVNAASIFNLAVYNADQLVGVVMVGSVGARVLQEQHPDWKEVNKLCVAPGLPGWMSRNACSMLYAAACKRAAELGYKRLITYTRADESGWSVASSGWRQTHFTPKDYRSGQARPGRKPKKKKSREKPSDKYRWERGLDKRERRAVALAADKFAEDQAELERKRHERAFRSKQYRHSSPPPGLPASMLGRTRRDLTPNSPRGKRRVPMPYTMRF